MKEKIQEKNLEMPIGRKEEQLWRRVRVAFSSNGLAATSGRLRANILVPTTPSKGLHNIASLEPLHIARRDSKVYYSQSLPNSFNQ